MLYPDALLDFILEQLAYEGTTGVTWDRLWEIVRGKTEVDEFYKKIIYTWIKANSNFELIEISVIVKNNVKDGAKAANDSGDNGKDDVENSKNGDEKAKDDDEMAKDDDENTETIVEVKEFPGNFDDAHNYQLRVKDEFQWITLTGAPKQNNPIGKAPFQLLVAIAQARESGIDSAQLIKDTNQDKRSLTSRIKTLSPFIEKIQIIKNGRLLSLFFLSKFYDPSKSEVVHLNVKDEEISLNVHELREKITTALKSAKSNIRQVNDLRRELQMDKTIRLKRVFKSCISFLERRGCLSKILVVSPNSPSKKIRAVRFSQDYVADEQQNTDALYDDDGEDEEEEDEGDMIDDQLKDIDDDEPSSSMKVMGDLQVVEASQNIVTIPKLNRFYPLQSQIYSLADSSGTQGCSSIVINNELFGPSYTRSSAKLMEIYTTGKLLPHIANYGIIRHYDFQGRVKFYRYLSRSNLLRLSNQPEDLEGSVLPQIKLPTASLEEIDKESHIPLILRLEYHVQPDGTKTFFWFGNTSEMPAEFRNALKYEDGISRKRGRPKKGEEGQKKPVKRPKKLTKSDKVKRGNSETETISIAAPGSTDTGTDARIATEEQTAKQKQDKTSSGNDLIISDLKAKSFREIERLSAILRVLEDGDGVRENSYQFLEEVREEVGYKVDRRTFQRDLSSLVEQKKMKIEKTDHKVNSVGDEGNAQQAFDLLISAYAAKETIDSVKKSLEGKRQKEHLSRTLDEVNAEIDFFDTELRDTFNRPRPQVIKPPKKLKPSKTIIDIKKKHATHTAKVDATQPLDPNAPPEILKKKKAGKTSKNPAVVASEELQILKKNRDKIVKNRPVVKNKPGRKRKGANLSNEETLKLFKAVVICKTITESQIDWHQIALLFDDVSAHDLKSKWPKIRMMMGQNGFKLARRTWKKILIAAVKERRIDLEKIEGLDLSTLLDLWTDSQLIGLTIDNDGEKLYANIEDNYTHYGFVKSKNAANQVQYDHNSMVQRELFLVSQVSTFKEDGTESEDDAEVEEITKDDTIRSLIIAIISSGKNFEIEKLKILEQYTKEEIDAVFLKMVKKRELYVTAESKVLLGDKLTSILEDNTYDFSLATISKFQTVLKDLLTANKALVLDPVFDNSIMVPLLELIRDNALNLTRVDHYRKEVLFGYEARTIERDKLEGDIIITNQNTEEIKEPPSRMVKIPMGKPCSHIWIDLSGQINGEVWKKLVRVLLTTILAQPGITEKFLYKVVAPLLSKSEFKLVIGWLEETGAITKGEMSGYWLEPQWYIVLGLY